MAEQHNHDVVVIGAGVAGICQIKHLVDHGFDAVVLEANNGLGGTWYNNRYPGCRFDSESYTYGYAFSRELVDQWHWQELFSPQPENLKYLNFVADKFDLRRHIRCNAPVAALAWDDAARQWTVTLGNGERYTCRFVITCTGVLSAPTLPAIDGIDSFQGEAFHTFHWPHQPVALAGRRVGIIGTGATGIQIIAEIADKVAELTVFQRRPNWSVPLNNAPISASEMAAIRARHDQILANCAATNGGFEHVPDRRGWTNVTPEQRRALWDDLYDRPGFSLLLANFPETFLDEEANRALSDYVAERIRQRVQDPVVAETLIPKDHGFGMRRLPLESNYFEAYNRSNVHLVDLLKAPIERITPAGIQTTAGHHDLDLIIHATGFDAITGALERLDVRGTDGHSLRQHWQGSPATWLGVASHGFPNLLMVAGPQSVSGSTNYPRAIEDGVGFITGLLRHARSTGATRLEVNAAAEQAWVDEVQTMQDRMPFARTKSWFTGHNPNVAAAGRAKANDSGLRYVAYWGGAPRYREFLRAAEEAGYPQVTLD